MSSRRYELTTDRERSVLRPLLPNKLRGIPRVDDRKVLNGILWRFRTGSPWREILERYGPSSTYYNRFLRWRRAGAWNRLLETVSAACDGEIVMIDRSCIRAHQHPQGARRRRRRLSPAGSSASPLLIEKTLPPPSVERWFGCGPPSRLARTAPSASRTVIVPAPRRLT